MNTKTVTAIQYKHPNQRWFDLWYRKELLNSQPLSYSEIANKALANGATHLRIIREHTPSRRIKL